MNWILYVVIGIIVMLGLIGYRKGLVKMVFSLTSTIIAILLAAFLSPVVAQIIKSNDKIVDFLDEKVSILVDFSAEDSKETKASKQEDLIESLPLPESIKQSLAEDNTEEEYEAMQVEDFEGYVCRRITNVIINAISFIIVLIIAIVALWFVCSTLNILAKLPLLRQLNTTAGLGVGLAEGVLLVWILFAVLTMFVGTKFGREAMELIGENRFLDFLYKNNLVSKFIAR